MSDILVGKGEKPVYLLAKYGNRHGLVAGATGTGKTITLEVLVEGFSRVGVPVFISDVKGDVSGMALAGARTKSFYSGRIKPASRTLLPKQIRWFFGICTARRGTLCGRP